MRYLPLLRRDCVKPAMMPSTSVITDCSELKMR